MVYLMQPVYTKKTLTSCSLIENQGHIKFIKQRAPYILKNIKTLFVLFYKLADYY